MATVAFPEPVPMGFQLHLGRAVLLAAWRLLWNMRPDRRYEDGSVRRFLPMSFRMATALVLGALAVWPATARAEDGLFARIGRALDRGVMRGQELVAEGAEGAGRGLQRAGEATGQAAERLGRQLRPDPSPAPAAMAPPVTTPLPAPLPPRE
jgi:hypothetical protein